MAEAIVIKQSNIQCCKLWYAIDDSIQVYAGWLYGDSGFIFIFKVPLVALNF